MLIGIHAFILSYPRTAVDYYRMCTCASSYVAYTTTTTSQWDCVLIVIASRLCVAAVSFDGGFFRRRRQSPAGPLADSDRE